MTQFASTLYPQTNPTNPILLELRNDLPGDRSEGMTFAESIANSLHVCCRPWWARSEATDAQLDHARRVLTRLAAFTG